LATLTDTVPATLDAFAPGESRKSATIAGISGQLALVAFVALVVGAACGVPASAWQFNRDLLAADDLADDGHHAEAYERYRELAARSPRDDIRSELRIRLGVMRERMGDVDGALRHYAEAYNNPRSLYDHHAGDAMYRSARLMAAEQGPDAAEPLFRAIVTTYANTFAADDALGWLLERYRSTGRSAAIAAWMIDVYPPLMRTEVADNLAYWTARVMQEDLSNPAAALELYSLLITQFHPSNLMDDSIWRSTVCYRELGRTDDEYRLLKAFIDVREVSWIMADYESEYYRPTLERMAEIHEERGELREAIAVWERFQTTYRLSLYRDDNQFHIMELQRDLGDIDGMRASLAWLREEYPRSRFVRQAEALLAETLGEGGGE